MTTPLRIAIIGAGPSGLFLFKKILEAGVDALTIDLFEKSDIWGAGMPYGPEGACNEHVTNVSANEVPPLVMPVDKWIHTVEPAVLKRFNIDPAKFHEYKVLPRLLFGRYLSSQFDLLLKTAQTLKIKCNVYFQQEVTNIVDDPTNNRVEVISSQLQKTYDRVVICTGHVWPNKKEQQVPGYFDSPYPPSKLAFTFNHPVAIRGASLTAIDAIKTLSRQHGTFQKKRDGRLTYKLHSDNNNFRIVMHSLYNMLPAVRFHVDDSALGIDDKMSLTEIAKNRAQNDGFLSLDYVFDEKFKKKLKNKQPDFYNKIKDITIEEFVDVMMGSRERKDPFELLESEYEAAEKSISEHRSIHWKETLSTLSFIMNYPAKYFAAEDMLRLKKILQPLISIVIAFVPQQSAQELFALHEAGILSLVEVGKKSSIKTKATGGIVYHYTDEGGKKHTNAYQTFVDCTGQSHLSYEEFPFKGLLAKKTVSPATLQFRDKKQAQEMLKEEKEKISKDKSGNYYLRVPGVAINDFFQLVNDSGESNERIFIMAVPLIGGYNPDFSGLDFCNTASSLIAERLIS